MSIIVIGSANTDMVVTVPTIPREGQTILGNSFNTYLGGKGANQAVAAARAGGDVIFIASLGQDSFADVAIAAFEKEGIDTHCIIREAENSGVALIMVNEQGKNCIAVAPEANMQLSVQHIQGNRETLLKADVVLAQLETPIDTIMEIARITRTIDAPFILNPAPAQTLSDELLNLIDVITPNESEAKMLTGIDVIDEESAHRAAMILKDKGIATVIITMGEQGAYLCDESYQELIPAHKVDAVDSTAAGDIFNGALALALASKKEILQAVKFSNTASALSVMKHGAQASAPTLGDIEHFNKLGD